ncbi:helix-turn-helix domain-containing protein [Microvirga solisilvae]|uniref:helix-turn-helix domain-containing protein n=1 Tax=Microvirga solisilvae TaxID=2919498 RepID=UPI001FAED805|nr:helix-turn-helix domain-containing protein [Microvirga solisilvae]
MTPVADSVIIGLADEGIPVAAIARATRRPSADVFETLTRALERGEIVEMPKYDWRPGERRGKRLPVAAVSFTPEECSFALVRVLGVTPMQARLLACLLRRGEATKGQLMAAMHGDETETAIDVVDVQICNLRKRLKPLRLAISTVWGHGYAITRETTADILALIGLASKAEEAA